MDQTLPLVHDGDHARRFLPGFSRPGSAAIFAGVWPDLVDAFLDLGAIGIDVIIDAGRLGPVGLPGPLAEAAAFTCLVVRSDLRAVVSAQIHLPIVLGDRGQPAAAARIGLLVVGEGKPYAAGEIGRALGVGPAASIPYDPTAAGHLSDGRERTRKFAGSAFDRALHTTAADWPTGSRPCDLVGSRS